MRPKEESKIFFKRAVMFLIGFNILQPTFLVFSSSYYAVVRFGFPRTTIGTFVNRTNISITLMAGISSLIMSFYLLWIVPKFNLSNYNRHLSVLTVCLAFVFDALALIAYCYGGERGNITFYYWALVMTAICLGTNQLVCPIIDPKNIPFFAFGIPVSELRVFFYHVLFRQIAAKIGIVDIDFKLVFGQLLIATIASFTAAILWVYCHYEEGYVSEYVQLQIDKTADYMYKDLIISVREQPTLEGFRKYMHLIEGDGPPYRISNISNKDVHIGDISLPIGIFRGTTVYTSGSDATILLVEIRTECKLDKRTTISTYNYFFFNTTVSKWFGYRVEDRQEIDATTISTVLVRLKAGMFSEIPREIVETLEPANRNKNFWLAFKQGYPFMLMFGLSIALLCAFYPAIVPYKLIDPDRGYYVDIINMFIRTLPALANCVICNVPSLKKYSPQCDWRERKWWRFSWLIFVPYLFAIFIAFPILHYPDWAVSRLVKNNTEFVGLLTTTIGFCFVTGRSIGLTSLPYQKSANMDLLTGKPMDNVSGTINTQLVSSCMMLYYILSVIIIPAGNGYHRAYSKYEGDRDNWPTRHFGFWRSLGFWCSEAVSEGLSILGSSFTTDLTKYMSQN